MLHGMSQPVEKVGTKIGKVALLISEPSENRPHSSNTSRF
jgi:hypothetical protein